MERFIGAITTVYMRPFVPRTNTNEIATARWAGAWVWHCSIAVGVALQLYCCEGSMIGWFDPGWQVSASAS